MDEQQGLTKGWTEMKELTLKVKPVTEEAMLALEERGLLQRLLPTENVLHVPAGEVRADYIYTTDPQFGSHTLICAGFNRSRVELATHSDNEEILLINEGRAQKPLILVIGLYPEPTFTKLLSSGQLTEEDVWALELKFNDTRLSFFTMNALTPHCEWTTPGLEPANVFYVTEPSSLDMRMIDMHGYTIDIDYLPDPKA
jgi:hypothetical protein